MQWYIMTSPATDAATQDYFRQQDHFGLQPAQVHFFQQVPPPPPPPPRVAPPALLTATGAGTRIGTGCPERRWVLLPHRPPAVVGELQSMC